MLPAFFMVAWIEKN